MPKPDANIGHIGRIEAIRYGYLPKVTWWLPHFDVRDPKVWSRITAAGGIGLGVFGVSAPIFAQEPDQAEVEQTDSEVAGTLLAAALECPPNATPEQRAFWAMTNVPILLTPTISADRVGLWTPGTSLNTECFVEGDDGTGRTVRWRRISGIDDTRLHQTGWIFPQGYLSDTPVPVASVSAPEVTGSPEPTISGQPNQTDEEPTPPTERAFPEQIEIGPGSFIYNLADGISIDLSPLAWRETNGKLCFGICNPEGGKWETGHREENLAYVQKMFEKYGKGRQLKIYLSQDIPSHIPQPTRKLQYFPTVDIHGAMVDGAIELHHVIKPGFDELSIEGKNDFVRRIIGGGIWTFLGAYEVALSKEEIEGYLIRGSPGSPGIIRNQPERITDLNQLGDKLVIYT